jgi:hydrogenase maturation factor
MSAAAERPMSPQCDAVHGCITCSDEAIPMRIVALHTEPELAVCEDETGAQREVMITLVAPVERDDVILVHAGTALQRVERTFMRRGRS